MRVDLNNYFSKIKIDIDAFKEVLKRDKAEALKCLYYAHVKAIPYNNLELRKAAHQHPVQRASLTFFNHTQVMNQGGYCFQTNALLYSVLTQLGFALEFCLARALIGAAVNAPELLRLPETHVILVVSIEDQRFLLEPGMGMQAPRFPILIQNSKEPIIQRNDEFRFYQEGDIFVLEKKMKNLWFTLMQTDLLPRSEQQLKNNLLKLERSPQILRIRDEKTLLAVLTDKGGKALLWDVRSNQLKFMKQEDEVFTQELITDFDVAHDLLGREFNMYTVSADDLKHCCHALQLPQPKKRWEIEFPLTAKDIELMKYNLAPMHS
jgi:N-hydroxyarylamine O-acetyltransferase